MTGAFPNLLVIGAPKCGTTSLHHYLDQHPDVAMSGQKELRFFIHPDWRRRVDWYRAQFDPWARIRGESTPAYAVYPAKGDVAARVHALLPSARLIYVVRDPLDRLVSHWAQTRADSRHRSFRRPVPRRSFAESLRDPEHASNEIVWASRYASQLERYLRLFRDEQLLVLDYADLRNDRRGAMGRVFEFLGLDPLESGEFDRELNTRAEKQELTGIGAPLWNHLLWPLGRRLPRRLRRPFAEPLKRAVRRPVVAPGEWPPGARERLLEILQPEADRLRALTGARFATWSV